MVDYEDFWVSLQLGKWRAEAIQKIFSARVTALFAFTILLYLGLAIYFVIIPQHIPGFSNIDFLTPISAMVGFFVAMLGIKFGFESYFVQQRAKPDVITYCGLIEYQDARTLVTFVNKGTTVAIRHIALLAARDKRRILDFGLRGIPSIEIFALATIFHGWRILGEGKSAGVLEKDIRQAIKEIALKLKDEKEVNTLYITIMAFDEKFDITRQESLNETLLAGCKMGNYLELVKYATDEKEVFPGLISGVKTYMEIPHHFHEGRIREAIPVKFIGEVPPSVMDIDFEIWQKLDSIEKLLSRIAKENKNRKKHQRSAERLPPRKTRKKRSKKH